MVFGLFLLFQLASYLFSLNWIWGTIICLVLFELTTEGGFKTPWEQSKAGIKYKNKMKQLDEMA